jgi:hypothetical protein
MEITQLVPRYGTTFSGADQLWFLLTNAELFQGYCICCSQLACWGRVQSRQTRLATANHAQSHAIRHPGEFNPATALQNTQPRALIPAFFFLITQDFFHSMPRRTKIDIREYDAI